MDGLIEWVIEKIKNIIVLANAYTFKHTVTRGQRNILNMAASRFQGDEPIVLPETVAQVHKKNHDYSGCKS